MRFTLMLLLVLSCGKAPEKKLAAQELAGSNQIFNFKCSQDSACSGQCIQDKSWCESNCRNLTQGTSNPTLLGRCLDTCSQQNSLCINSACAIQCSDFSGTEKDACMSSCTTP